MGDDRDARILMITRELCERLDISKHIPKSIVWMNSIYVGGRTRRSSLVRSDQPIIHRGWMTLADRVRAKLEPDDWRSLLASSLVYCDKWQRKLFTHLFTRLFLPALAILLTALFWLFFVYDSRQVSGQVPRVASIVLLTAILGAIAVGGCCRLLTSRRCGSCQTKLRRNSWAKTPSYKRYRKSRVWVLMMWSSWRGVVLLIASPAGRRSIRESRIFNHGHQELRPHLEVSYKDARPLSQDRDSLSL